MARQLRNLEREDAPAVALLIHQLTQNVAKPEELEKRIEMLVLPGNWQYVVVEEEGQIVAFGGLVWYPIPSKGWMGMVEEVVVDEKHRGQNLGEVLMLGIMQLAEEHGLLQVKLTTANPAAEHLYQRFHFNLKEEKLLVRKYY